MELLKVLRYDDTGQYPPTLDASPSQPKESVFATATSAVRQIPAFGSGSGVLNANIGFTGVSDKCRLQRIQSTWDVEMTDEVSAKSGCTSQLDSHTLTQDPEGVEDTIALGTCDVLQNAKLPHQLACETEAATGCTCDVGPNSPADWSLIAKRQLRC